MMAAFEGLWEPFSTNLRKFIDAQSAGAIKFVRGKSTLEEETGIWERMHSKHGAGTITYMDPPETSPFVDGLAAFLIYTSPQAEQRAIREGSKYGLSIHPRMPQHVEPMGLRATPTPYEVPDVDTAKFTRGSPYQTRMQSISDALEGVYGEMFYGTPTFDEDDGPIDVDALLAAIREQESGGDYNAVGREVEGQGTAKGAYQFMDATWEGASRLTNMELNGVDVPMTFTPDNQDLVARRQVTKYLKDFDNDVGAVGVAWYGGPGRVKQYLAGKDSDTNPDHPEEPTIMGYATQIQNKYSNLVGTVPKQATTPMPSLAQSSQRSRR